MLKQAESNLAEIMFRPGRFWFVQNKLAFLGDGVVGVSEMGRRVIKRLTCVYPRTTNKRWNAAIFVVQYHWDM